MELLLHLIERREMDVTRLSLAAVTDDFLRTIRQMERTDPDSIADFLVIAAKLLLLKSSLLLPSEQAEPPEEDEGENLARTLLVYRQFKEVALGLGQREAEGLHAYARLAAPPDLAPQRMILGNVSPLALLAAFQKVLREQEPEPENVDEVVRPLRITVRQRISDLAHTLRAGRPLPFEALLSGQPSRQEVIATFLALLEVLKLGWARVEQQELWGRIELHPIAEALPAEEADGAPDEVNEYV